MSEHIEKTTSEELDERQKQLAAEEGGAYQRSVRHMIEEVAETGGTERAGDYRVGFALEEAEGLYEFAGDGNGELEWTEPADDENCHVEVVVADAADGRFVPGVDVSVRMERSDGQEVGPFEPSFLWHPGLYHYGQNVHVPEEGTYTIRISVDPPTFHRHDRENGDRYADAVEVEFEGVDVTTGQS